MDVTVPSSHLSSGTGYRPAFLVKSGEKSPSVDDFRSRKILKFMPPTNQLVLKPGKSKY